MRRLKKFTLLLLLFCPVILRAQYSDFDLSRYKLPDIKLSRLDANINLTSRGYSENVKPSNSDKTESKQKRFDSGLNFNYYHFRNSEKYQGEVNSLLTGDLNKHKNKDEDTDERSNSSNLHFILNSTNRFFKGKNFVEIDPGVSIIKSKLHNEPTTNSENTVDNLATDFSIPISIGHGRIEPVEDLRLAIFILEELNKAGRIRSLPPDNVLLEMAKEISKIKNQRFFDSRIRKIKELQVVDSFLLANNIISATDITYFAVLNDQWDYASGPVREAGFAFDFGIDDQIAFNRSHQKYSYNDGTSNIFESIYNSYYVAGFSRVRYAKPINLYWQTSASLKVAYGFEFNKDKPILSIPADNYRTNIFSSILEYSIMFLPNSRTSAELYLSGNYSGSIEERTSSGQDFQITDNLLTCNAGLEIYYYISPKLRLLANSNLVFNNFKQISTFTQPSVENLTTRFNNVFGISLIYSFF